MSCPCCEITQLDSTVWNQEMRWLPLRGLKMALLPHSLFCGALRPSFTSPPPCYFILVEEFISQQGPFSSTHTSCLALFGSRRKGVESNTSQAFQNCFEISLLLALDMFLIPSLTFLICKMGTNMSRLLWTSNEIKFINV